MSAADHQNDRSKISNHIKQILLLPAASQGNVDIYGLATARTIASLSQSILILERNGMISDAIVLLRSSFEHVIELDAIYHGNKDLFDRRVKSYFKKEQLTQDFANTGNLWLKGLTGEKFDQHRKHIAAGLEKSKDSKEPQDLRCLAAAAGLEDAYNSFYRSTSNLAHPTIEGAIERNPEIFADKNSNSSRLAHGMCLSYCAQFSHAAALLQHERIAIQAKN